MTNADHITNKLDSAWNYVSTSLPCKRHPFFYSFRDLTQNEHELNLISRCACADGHCIGAP